MMRRLVPVLSVLLGWTGIALFPAATPARAETLKIKLATLAPDGMALRSPRERG